MVGEGGVFKAVDGGGLALMVGNVPKVIHVIDSLGPGGAQHVLLAVTCTDADAQVCVIHANGGAGEMTSQFQRVAILARSKYSVPAILFRLVRMVLRYRSLAFFNAHLEASTLFLCLLRRLIDFRLVVTVHSTQAQWPRWFRVVFRRIVFYADHVIVESRRALDEVGALGVASERITLIPLGTMRTAVRHRRGTADIREDLGIAADMPIFLNVARMVPGKGQIHLVRAMASVPSAVAVIVGYGPEEQNLRREVSRLGLRERVFFAGMRTDLDNFYSAARAFVMPCVDESMGIVVYDALTFRLPVVAYASGSIAEIVTDGENGYLLPPDPDALARALRRVLRNETEFRFKAMESYSATTMADRHKALYLALEAKWFIPTVGQVDA